MAARAVMERMTMRMMRIGDSEVSLVIGGGEG